MELILVMFGLPALMTAALTYVCGKVAEGADPPQEDSHVGSSFGDHDSSSCVYCFSRLGN